MRNKGSLIEGYDGDLTLVTLKHDESSTTLIRTKVITPYAVELTGCLKSTPSLMGKAATRSRGALRGIPVTLPGSAGRALGLNDE